MESEIPLYSNIDASEFAGEKPNQSASIVVKKTLIPSPIFVNIYPSFMVKVNKPFRGLSGMSLNDEEYQNMLPCESTSQLEAFEDDDLFMELDQDDNDPALNHSEEAIFESVKVIVKSKSLMIDEIEFPINVEIRSCAIIKGKQKLDGTFEEDSLFICLKSGYLLLIRLYYVPRYYKDSDYEYQTSKINHEGDSIFKPFVVQWWDASSTSLKSSGFQLRSDRSGLTVVSTSAYRSFRIYNTESTPNGIILRKHINVFVEGLILHSCFAQPLHELPVMGHVSFLTMVYTDHRRLLLQLYSWSCDEGTSINLSKSTLPLDNTFRIPIFIIPLKLNGGFLFVSPDEIVLVTIHQIISAEYDFKKFEPPWRNISFPTNFYTPSTEITTHLETVEEILISTDNGTIYSLKTDFNNYGLQFNPILRIPNSISVFSLESHQDGYTLIFGSDGENNQELLIPALFTEENNQKAMMQNKLNYINAGLLRNFSNWSPLIDIEIVDSVKSPSMFLNKKELWGLTGNGKRSKITHFRYGYSAKRRSKIYDKLRKCIRLFYTPFQGKTYFLCSFSFKSILLEIQNEADYSFLEIDNVAIDRPILFALTLKFEKFDNFEAILYITPSKISLTNFTDFEVSETLENRRIVFAELKKNYLSLIVEELSGNGPLLVLELYLVNLEIISISDRLFGNVFTKINAWTLSFQPSSICCFFSKQTMIVSIGTYEGDVYFYKTNDSNKRVCESLNKRVLIESENHPDMLLVPSDIIFVNDSLFVGTMDGCVITFSVSENLDLDCKRFLKLSESPIHFGECEDTKLLLFIVSKDLWLLNLYESEYPERVYFEETNERSVNFLLRLPTFSGRNSIRESIAVIREDGLTMMSVLSFKEPNLRQVTIGERASTFQYLNQYGLFVLMCKSKHVDGRLKFVERKGLKFLPHQEFDLKSNEEPGNIFEKNEFPLTSCIWTIQRGDRLSKKLLIGCSIDSEPTRKSGCIKVLDILKFKTQPDMNTSVRVLELTTFSFPKPIVQVLQIDESILFSGGNSVFCTSYDAEIKKLKPSSCLTTLPSDITFMAYQDNLLLVTTKYDSLFQFKIKTSSKGLSLHLSFHDAAPNSFVNHCRVNSHVFSGDKLHSSILILNENKEASRTSFRVSCIARVYASNFTSPWKNLLTDDEEYTNTICVGVNGEVFSLRLVKLNSKELESLSAHTESSVKSISIEELMDKWMLPVRNKVSGTGLFSVNKLCFDYKENIGKLVDYDLDSIKATCPVKVYL